MSLLTINITETTETPAAVQLVTFTNPDTGADISASVGLTLPAALTLASGEWSIAFTDIGLAAYDYTYTFTWADGSTSPPVAGRKRGGNGPHYGSRQGMINLLGPYNEQQAADVDADANATKIANQEEAALTDADNSIDAKLIGAGISLPISSSDSDYRFLIDAGCLYAAVALNRMRGLPQDSQGRTYDPYKGYTAEADAMMDLFIAGRLYPDNNKISAPVSGNVSLSARAALRVAPFGCW